MKQFRSLPVSKTRLVKLMADRAELSQAQSLRALNAMIDSIAEALRDGQKVTISGFGRFEARKAVAHSPFVTQKRSVAANQSPTERRPAFKASATFKRAVAGHRD